LLKTFIRQRSLDNLIEELVGLVEICAKAFVDPIDQSRERHRLPRHKATKDFGWSVERTRVTLAEVDL
jgi:hypothetical protein